MVAIAKFRSYDKNRDKKKHARQYYLIFGDSSSKSVDTGLSTEWGDRVFQSIIVRGNSGVSRVGITGGFRTSQMKVAGDGRCQ